jgi:hypothetical protein
VDSPYKNTTRDDSLLWLAVKIFYVHPDDPTHSEIIAQMHALIQNIFPKSSKNWKKNMCTSRHYILCSLTKFRKYFCGLCKNNNCQCNKITVYGTFFCVFIQMPQEMSFRHKTLMDEHRMFKSKPRIFHLKLLTF